MTDFFRRFHKLIFRLIFTTLVVVFYVMEKDSLLYSLMEPFSFNIESFIFIVFILEIVYRFVPGENVGVSKYYKRYYKAIDYDKSELCSYRKRDHMSVVIMFVIFIIEMSLVTVLYLNHILDKGMILIFSMILWTLSEVCVEIFCPFSYLFFHKTCCNKCRFYNWDYFLMFCPLIFIGNVLSYVVVGVAFILLFVWEIAYAMHPYRFYEISNASLRCDNCTNLNCKYKKKVNTFVDKILGIFTHKGR